jgi:hypothetical protein
MQATVPAERTALKRWFVRFYGAGSYAYRDKLAKDPDFTYCSPTVLSKFRIARTRVSRLLRQGTAPAAPSAPSSVFMAWWRGCDKDGFAAWDPAVVMGARGVPRAAYNYWRPRYERSAGTSPITTVGQVGQAVERERIARLMEASKATPVSPMQPISAVRSAVPTLSPVTGVSSTATASESSGQSYADSGMTAMRGMGQTWTGLVSGIAGGTVRPAAVHVPCPTGSLKANLFGFTAAVTPVPPPAPAPEAVPRIWPRPTPTVPEATAAAEARARDEAERRRRMEQLEEQVAALQAQLSAATSAGAGDVMADLRAQVERLTASLAAAQQSHADAATAAATAHRDEVAALQAQIDALNAAMAASTDNTEIAGLRAQVEVLLGQLTAAEVAADEATEAAADSEAAYLTSASWFERNKTNLLIGAGVLVAGVIGWKMLSGRRAMALPAPTSPRAPAGLARNPRGRSYWRKGYSYMRRGKRVKVPGHYVGR